MTQRKSFVILLAITIVAVVIAAVAWQRQGKDEMTVSGNAPAAFPGLIDKVNDVDRLVIAAGTDGTTTLDKKDGRWLVAEKGGYPADFEKVRNTLLQLARLELLELRTTKPELYDRIDLEDASPTSKSMRITAGLKGQTVADVLVGKSRAAQSGGGDVFIRKVGDAQAWLARGQLRPERKIMYWLDRNITNVDQRRIASATITHPDGTVLSVGKGAVGDADYKVTSPMPPDRVERSQYDVRSVAGVLDFLILDDVRPATQVTFPEKPLTARFVTYDGMQVDMRGAEQDGAWWFTMQATAAPRDGSLDAFMANKGKDSDEGRIADQMKAADAVTKEIADFNAKANGWAFRVTDFKTLKLRSTLSDITDEKKPEETSTPPNTPATTSTPAPAAPAPAALPEAPASAEAPAPEAPAKAEAPAQNTPAKGTPPADTPAEPKKD